MNTEKPETINEEIEEHLVNEDEDFAPEIIEKKSKKPIIEEIFIYGCFLIAFGIFSAIYWHVTKI